MTNHDLDATIADEIFGWKLADVPKDANGENACQVLTPDGTLDGNYGEMLPPKGKLHRGYFTRPYSNDWNTALGLARHVGFAMLPLHLLASPETLARACLKRWKAERT